MTSLRKALTDYLELRRGLGYKMNGAGKLLYRFMVFMDAQKATRIATKLALEFATQKPHRCSYTMAKDLAVIRGFARYQCINDSDTEVPPYRLLPATQRPAVPYVYTDAEIARLLRAARDCPSRSRFPGPWWHHCRRWSWYCIFGLLAVTGMRIGEIRNVRSEDVDWQAGVLTIRNAKFGKSRLVPLHQTMIDALRSFLKHRDRFFARCQPQIVPQWLFVNSYGNPIAIKDIRRKFMLLRRQIGLQHANHRKGPRLHDFRHRFAIETLVRWYRSGEDVERLLPILATYLGHTNVSSTFWYLRCTPELMAAARDRLERRWKEGR